MREFVRRLVLLAGIGTAIGMAMSASLQPMVLVESVASEEGLPVIAVRGEEWQAFFTGTAEVMEHPWSHPESYHRMDAWRIKSRSSRVKELWFEPREKPLASIVEQVRAAPDQRASVALTEGDDARYLEVEYHSYSRDNWIAFIGFSGREPPPGSLFPLRPYWYLPLIAAILFYLFIPSEKRDRERDVAIPRWKLPLGDLISVILFGVFFLLPFFLGGPIQAFPNWWGIAAFCWPVSCLGLLALCISAWYAGFCITPGADALKIRSWSLTEAIDYRAIAKVSPAVVRPPRWLRIAMWIMAFMSKGRSKLLGFGEAAILEGTAYGGMTLELTDGRAIDFWYTDQMGNPTFTNLPVLKAALERAKVPFGTEKVERRGLGFGIALQGKGRHWGITALLTYFVTPFFVVAMVAVISGLSL